MNSSSDSKRWLRSVFAACILAISAAIVTALFWYQEVQYALPTPVPDTHQEVPLGTKVSLPESLKAASDKPVFIHFFNPDCPCSRFNLEHFNYLSKTYADQIKFVAAIEDTQEDATMTLKEVKALFTDEVQIIKDNNNQIAAMYGVYATPQAVLIDQHHTLYYRGNYNKNRYCTAKNTNFAQMATDSLLAGKARPDFGSMASVAYGCTLPE
jgi:thiol-disulfide isomerase/thioredoxin